MEIRCSTFTFNKSQSMLPGVQVDRWKQKDDLWKQQGTWNEAPEIITDHLEVY